ncbi:hypothetical protein [Sporichthya sp.]|nr:hypothetical protein [Sporichthya sp.]
MTAQLIRGEAWHLGIEAGDTVYTTAESSPRRPTNGAPDPIAAV